jgi:hypothetical protein
MFITDCCEINEGFASVSTIAIVDISLIITGVS